jgi:hypothetical protein
MSDTKIFSNPGPVTYAAPTLFVDTVDDSGVITTAAENAYKFNYDNQCKVVKLHRNALLAASDWTQTADAPVDKPSWAAYRQQLRDITTQQDYPWSVVWPNQPI